MAQAAVERWCGRDRPNPTAIGISDHSLVEDDPTIRSLVGRMLKGAGYELLTTRNGDDTLTLAKAHPGEIYLLLTDIVMPRMKGFELGSARPETSVLFLS